MTKLYAVVTDDSYDEGTTIHGVYTTPELAAEAMRRYGADRIEEQHADVLPELTNGKYAWAVTWTGDKFVARYHSPSDCKPEQSCMSWNAMMATVYCFAADESQAIEIAKASLPRIQKEHDERKRADEAKHFDNAVQFTVTRDMLINDATGQAFSPRGSVGMMGSMWKPRQIPPVH